MFSTHYKWIDYVICHHIYILQTQCISRGRKELGNQFTYPGEFKRHRWKTRPTLENSDRFQENSTCFFN